MKFYKMHGAGNDFVMLTGLPELTTDQIQKICHRRTGIGADGLIFVEKAAAPYNFIMHYFNSDGSRADYCGNGARCALYLARQLDYFSCEKAFFLAGDGEHTGMVLSNTRVSVSINSPKDFKHIGEIEGLPYDLYYVNTGVEHVVCYCDELDQLDVDSIGRKIRYNSRFSQGTNVNFIRKGSDGIINIRTYERGVEAETLACGTGISAAAYIDMQIFGGEKFREISTVAGFSLSAGWQAGVFTLTGPAEIVAEGQILIDL